MSIKTPKRLVLGVIASLVFAPFAAVAPASATETGNVSEVAITAPAIGRVNAVFTSTVKVAVSADAASNDTITLRARFDERPAGSAAVVGFSTAGKTMVDNDGTTALGATIAAAGAAGNELLPAKITLAPASGERIDAVTISAAAAVAGSVGFIPDVVGTYKILVWHDSNGDGLVGATEKKSAVTTFTVGSAVASVKATAVSGASIADGANGALVKLELLDSAGAAAGLASNEAIRLTSSGAASSDFILANGSVITDSAGVIDLVAANFADGISYINMTDTTAATRTVTISGVGGSVTAISGTFTQIFRTDGAGAAGGSTVLVTTATGTTGAVYGTASTIAVAGTIVATSIPVGAKSLHYRITTTNDASTTLTRYVPVAITDTSGDVTGSSAIDVTGLAYDRAITVTAADDEATTSRGNFTITTSAPALGSVFSFVVSDDADGTTGDVTSVAANANSGDVTVTPSGAISLATGSSITYSATVVDMFGRAVSNASVAMSGGTRNAIVTPPTAVTNANGVASFTRADAPAAGVTSLTDTFTFTASYAGGSSSGNSGAITWSATGPVVSTVTLETGTEDDTASSITYRDINAGSTGTQAGAATIEATVKDASGNLLAGVAVTFSTASEGAAVLSTSVTKYTGADGTVTASVYGWTAGTKTFTATAGGVSGTGTVNYRQETATEARTVSASISGKLVTVNVKDRFGNPVKDVNILGTRTGTGYFGSGSTTTTGLTDKDGNVGFVVEGVGTFTFAAATAAGVADTLYGQTCAVAGKVSCAATATAVTAFVAGTATVAETGVGAEFAAAGVNSASVTTTAPPAPPAPPVVYDKPTLSFVKSGNRIFLSGTAENGEGDIIIYVKRVGTTAWKERAKTLEVAAPGDFNGSIRAPKNNVVIRVKQEGTGLFSNQIIVLK